MEHAPERIGYPLSSTQKSSLWDSKVFPENDWSIVRWSTDFGFRLSEGQARQLILQLAGRHEGLRSRIAGSFPETAEQVVLGLDEYLETNFQYRIGPDALRYEADTFYETLDPYRHAAQFLVVSDDTNTVVHLVIHHAFCDEESMEIVSRHARDAAAALRRHQELDDPAGLRQSLRPRDVSLLETEGAGKKSTERWLAYHSDRTNSDRISADLATTEHCTEYAYSLAMGPEFYQAAATMAKVHDITIPSFLNILVSQFIGVEFAVDEVPIETVYSNRHRRQTTNTVARLAQGVWAALPTGDIWDRDHCRQMHGKFLSAYKHGFYDWDLLSPSFPSPFRSHPMVLTNIHPDWTQQVDTNSAPGTAIEHPPVSIPTCLTNRMSVAVAWSEIQTMFTFRACDYFMDQSGLRSLSINASHFLQTITRQRTT